MFKSPSLPSAKSYSFSKMPEANIPRSTFNRNHTYKTTFGTGGYLYPIYCDEALPGDTFSVKISSIARMGALMFPLMDNLHMDFFFFSCPNRILWSNWERFMGAQDSPGDSTDFTVPVITTDSGGVQEASLSDYMGLPIKKQVTFNALHHRMYNRVYNDWFRDENLQGPGVVHTDDGPDPDASYELLKRSKRFDYFTGCLPWPQKGDSVLLPLGDSAPVTGIGKTTQVYPATGVPVQGLYETGGTTADYAAAATINSQHADNAWYVEEDPANTGYPGIYADLSNATASSINSIREAFQLQKMLERDARSGTRYCELIQSHFLVRDPSMAVLQRPEYLGGGTSQVNVAAVAQTQRTDTDQTPQGHLTGIGTHSQSGIGFTKSFTEHSCIMCLVNFRADLTYQQQFRKMWQRQTRYDFYFPALAHLGEQSVSKGELFYTGNASDDEVFGYQERWAEYKHFPSQITCELRSNATLPLDSWHLSEEFGTQPVLNSTFIKSEPPIERVISIPVSNAAFVFDGYFQISCTRPMPMYSIPGLVDHF